MKSFQILFVLLLSASVFVGCKKKADNNNTSNSDTKKTEVSADKFDKMAVEACGCFKEMASIMDKVAMLQKEGKTDELLTATKEIEANQKETEACVSKIEKKYGIEDNESNGEKMEAAMKKNCPSVAKMFELAGADE